VVKLYRSRVEGFDAFDRGFDEIDRPQFTAGDQICLGDTIQTGEFARERR